jgi:dTMP kinase
MKKGFFVAIEGIDGSGKSTQSVLLYNRLKELGYPVFHTRPGESDKDIVSPVNKAIKMITHDPCNRSLIGTETEVMLYMAQNSQAVNELIIPRLNMGEIVIADRYVYSTYALCHYGRGVELDFLKQIGDFTTHRIVPDVTVLTDLPAELAFQRKEKAGKELGRKELMGPEFFEKVRQGFLIMSNEMNRKKWLVVDDSTMSIKEAEKYIWDSVFPLIKEGWHK